MPETCRLRQGEGYEVCADEVRVETCDKSARIGVEASVAVNSIRSNTVEGNIADPASPWRWLERTGDGTRR